MNWFQSLKLKLSRVFPGLKPKTWPGFKEIKDVKVDTPEEFRDRNNV